MEKKTEKCLDVIKTYLSVIGMLSQVVGWVGGRYDHPKYSVKP